MRWILIGLLMMNSIYFLWHTLQEQVVVRVGAGPQTGNSDYKELLLLTELPGSSGYVPPAQDSVEALVIPAPGRVTVRGAVESLPSQRGVVAAVGVVMESPAVVAAPVATCWLIGPFVEQVSARQVVNRLQALDLTLELQSRLHAGKPDYWVYIPPQVSRKVAIALLRELQSNKIDSYLITDGELSKGLSLGFFTEQARADAVHRARMAQGYDARVKVVPRQYTEFWGVFDTRVNGEFTELLWEKVQSGNNALERHKNNCDKIASLDNLD